MDTSFFDALARFLSQPGSRRNALRLLLTGVVGGGALATSDDAEAMYNTCLPRCRRLPPGKLRKKCMRKAQQPWCWVDPTPQPLSCGSGTYAARYFGNTTLSGAPVLERCESVPIFHEWGYSSPGGYVPADYFSVRWTSRVFFSADYYNLILRGDDGIRVWFGSELVIDHWSGYHPGSLYTYSGVWIPQGSYDLRIEFLEYSGAAVAKFRWERDFTRQANRSDEKKSHKKSRDGKSDDKIEIGKAELVETVEEQSE